MAPYISSHLCDRVCLAKLHGPMDIHNNLVANTRKQMSATVMGTQLRWGPSGGLQSAIERPAPARAVLNW